MKKSQIMPYAIVGGLLFILVFILLIFLAGETNREMDIEVENAKNAMEDIKANMDKIKRCSEISLNGYIENLIIHSGFIESQKSLIQNETLKSYYDLVEFRRYNGNSYPILLKKLDIPVPEYPYNSAGNKYYYYKPVFNEFSTDIVKVIELSVKEFFPKYVKNCFEKSIIGVKTNLSSDEILVDFRLDKDYYNFKAEFKLKYTDSKNVSSNSLEFALRKKTKLSSFIEFVAQSIDKNSKINENFDLNNDYASLPGFMGGFSALSFYDTDGYYFYIYDSHEIIDLQSAKMSFFGEDSPPFLSFSDGNKEIMKDFTSEYDFEVLPNTNLTIYLEANDAQKQNELMYLISGYRATNKSLLNFSKCLANKADCLSNFSKYSEIVTEYTKIKETNLRNNFMEIEFKEEDVGPQELKVYLADEYSKETLNNPSHIYDGVHDGHMDYRNIKFLVLDNPMINLTFENFLGSKYNFSIEDPWRLIIEGDGIFSTFKARIPVDPFVVDSYSTTPNYNIGDKNVFSSLGSYDFKIEVWRYMNGELHSLYKNFNRLINVSKCTPYRNSSNPEYPFNNSRYYDHTSCKSNGEYQGIDNACFSKTFYDRLLLTNETFDVYDKSGIDIKNDYEGIGSYYIKPGIGYNYNISKFNDGYKYELEVNSSGNNGNICNGNKWYNVENIDSCESPINTNSDYIIFGSCNAYNGTSQNCESLDEPYEKDFLNFPNMEGSLEETYKSHYASYSTIFNINNITQLLSEGNCSYKFEGECENASCGCVSGVCAIPELYYFDGDGDLAVDKNNKKCQCQEKNNYKKYDSAFGWDCYDVNDDYGKFFNKKSEWKNINSVGDEGYRSIKTCNPFSYADFNLDIGSYPYIFTTNVTHMLRCGLINSNGLQTSLSNFNDGSTCIIFEI